MTRKDILLGVILIALFIAGSSLAHGMTCEDAAREASRMETEVTYQIAQHKAHLDSRVAEGAITQREADASYEFWHVNRTQWARDYRSAIIAINCPPL